MNKAELAEELSKRLGKTKKESAEAVDAVFAIILETLENGGDDAKVQVIPFGSFTKRKRKAREGRDPRTGKPIMIQERTVAVFTPGKALKEAVDK